MEDKEAKPKKKKEVVHREPEIQEISMRFANNALYLCRLNENWKMRFLEKEIGMHQGYMKRYAAGEFTRGIPIDLAFKASQVLGETLDDMCSKNYKLLAKKKRIARRNKSFDDMMLELGLR